MIRRSYVLRGVVQGVGMRPHVAAVARRHAVTGFVGNDPSSVFVEAQGDAAAVDAFMADVLAMLPPLATVLDCSSVGITPVDAEERFTIAPSRSTVAAPTAVTSATAVASTTTVPSATAVAATTAVPSTTDLSEEVAQTRTLIPPDVATCPDCLADMNDPGNRRHRYAFITCTNCGPRLSIINDLPYDRPLTTMRHFPMCPACQAEYDDPTDRRHHAQPISCYACGPRLWLASRTPATDCASAWNVYSDGSDWAQADDASVRPDEAPATATDQAAVLTQAIHLLEAGHVLAVKGLGGFHLMCDARSDAAVGRLRERKRRTSKPFAVMVRNIEAAHRLAVLSEAEAALLASPARPIVIAPKASGYDLSDDVAPGLADVGLLLPYTPLHSLLVDAGMPLVATSGNLSEEPLCFTNADALARLSRLADVFLLHDRDIAVPVEDSVYLGTTPTRRSRGYAPLPVVLSSTRPTVLAVGGELKNTFALAKDDFAHLSAHCGDMGTLPSVQAFEASVHQLLRMRRARPDVVVCDLHPGYATTTWAERYAETTGIPLIRVQHHHAHALALLAEHRWPLDQPIAVAALDGTGYGTDATIWGGEVLLVNGSRHHEPAIPGGADHPTEFTRFWHLPRFGLAGGDRAVRFPWRSALGLAAALDIDISNTSSIMAGTSDEITLVHSQLSNGFGIVQTSSAGRLFDAASALLGLCDHATYEAQAAITVEQAATHWAGSHPACDPRLSQQDDFPASASQHPDPGAAALRALVLDLLDTSRTAPERAWRFHCGLATMISDALAEAAASASTATVGLTGGVVMNRLLTRLLTEDLTRRGLTVLTHRIVPPNDGGLSLGQALAGRVLA